MADSYSWSKNNVSDLGMVECGTWTDQTSRYVCSPRHSAMNVMFFFLGAAIIAGVLLTWDVWLCSR